MGYVVADMDTCVSLAFVAFASANLRVMEIFPVLKNPLGNPMTYVTDPIGDLLTRIRNAQAVGKSSCTAPHSRMKKQLCDILKKEGWIADVEVEGEEPKLQVVVTFAEDKPALTLTRTSKPGRRVYSGCESLKPVLRGFGIAILTTSKGLMTDKESREQKIGGEVLCTIS